MEFHTTEQEIAVLSPLLDAFDERPMDCDFVLPDYCPDMAAVLGCTLEPVIGNAQWNGDRLMVDGTACIRVLYLGEERRCVHTYEVTQPFTSAFAVGTRLPQTALELTAKTDYVNCRAVSPRRIDIHGAFRVHAVAVGEGVARMLDTAGEEDVFVRRAQAVTSVPAGFAQKTFTVNETLDANGEKCRVVRFEAVPLLTDTKILAGKLIVKGELLLKNVYVCNEETGELRAEKYAVPFSQMLDMEGLTDELILDTGARVLAHDLRVEESEQGNSVQASVKLQLSAQAWRDAAADLPTDAYSCKMPLRLERGSLSTNRLCSLHRQTSTVKQSLDLPPEVATLADVWSEAQILSVDCRDGRCVAEGRLTVHLLGADAEGQISCYERSTDFTLDFPCEGGDETVSAEVISTDGTLSADNRLDLRVELAVKRVCREQEMLSVVTAISGDEQAAYPPERAAVKVVYAEAGEQVWNLAKTCHTSVEALMRENHLDTDTLPARTMLLVPMN